MGWPIFAPFSSYQPDRGYYDTQPATIGELNILYHYLETLRKGFNAALETINGSHQDLTDILTRLDSAEESIRELLSQQTQDEETVAKLRQNLTDLATRMDKLIQSGVIQSVTWTPTARGWTATVIGNQGSATHAVSLAGDDTIQVRTDQSDTATGWTLTTKGGSNDISRLGLHSADGRIELVNAGQPQSQLPVLSSDGALAVASDSGALDLTYGPKAQADHDDLQAAKAQQAKDAQQLSESIRLLQQQGRLTSAAVLTNGGTVTIHLYVRATDGQLVRDIDVPLPMAGDDSITVSADASGWHLSAADQLQRLPVLLTGTDLDAHDGSLWIQTQAYDPKTGQPVSKTASQVPIDCDTTMTVGTPNGTVMLSASGAVAQAKQYADTGDASLQHALDTLTTRIESLESTVVSLQSRLATAEDTAHKSVTNATMAVSKGDSEDTVVLTVTLYNGQGAIVAQLPAELRVMSPSNTIDTGVQVSEHTASLSFDTK